MSGVTMTREAELSWALHRAVLPYLQLDWPSAQRTIRENLSLLQRRPRAQLAAGWIEDWASAVDRGPDAVAAVAITEGERGDDLRQVSPLAGVLPQKVRMSVLQQVRGNVPR